jgi:divalent metal cation (Fe/Co/Zn/Cd) transporter
LSLLFPFVGLKINSWQLDPLGALLLSLFIIYDWSSTCLSNIIRLSGSSASDRVMQKVLFVAWRFESLVTGFKNITAYHAGDGIWVEIDILMDPGEKLMQAHDVAETLQYCLEGLSEVDRAFVSVDCKFGLF